MENTEGRAKTLCLFYFTSPQKSPAVVRLRRTMARQAENTKKKLDRIYRMFAQDAVAILAMS